MGIKVGIVGASGYAGAELVRLVSGHPGMELVGSVASTSVGTPIVQLHPQLAAVTDASYIAIDELDLAGVDLLFFALPHGTSAELSDKIPDRVAIVDLGADRRLQSSSQWESYYGGAYASPWLYALPELPGRRGLIANEKRVANPGCHATAINLALAPLLADELVEPTGIVVTSASGTSGAGRKADIALSSAEIMGSTKAYKVGGTHQHTAEIEQELALVAGGDVSVSLTPLLIPMPRGILAVCTAVGSVNASESSVRSCLDAAYAHEPFVHVLPEGQQPATAATSGSNLVLMQSAFDAHTQRVTVTCAIDNLGKGAASQAIQNANLMHGFDESAGLVPIGVAP